MIIIFDSFGVLLTKGLQSSISKLKDVLERPSKEIARVYRKWELLYDHGKIDEETFWRNFNQDLGTQVNGSVLRNIILSSYQLKEETVLLIKKMRKDFPVVLYTNYRKGWFDHLDKKYDISSLFDKVFISSETKLMKPDRKAFELVFQHYKVQPFQTVLIDDEMPNIESFNKIGGNGILFKNVYEAEIELRRICNLPMIYNDYYSGIILRTPNGNLILQRRDKDIKIENAGRLSVFGGRREGNETPQQCAIRELKEETSIEVSLNYLQQIFICSYPVKENFWILCHYFLVDNVDINSIDLHEGQNIEIWKPFNALKQPDLTTIPKILIQKEFVDSTVI